MALTKIPGELFDVDDLDLSDVGTIALDAIKGEADTDTSITFSGSNVITVKANNANQITFIDGAIVPSTDNDIDLGTSSVEFKDAFFDGTVTSDAFAGPLTGNVTGDVSGSSGSTTGLAATATALATGRTIGGTSFDGTANIAVALSATSTALATARTIGGTSFDGTANIAVALAATATALASARTIHGVSFDGTANIDLSEVVADTVGAMFSSNTETGITATYQDGDNTIDLVVGTLNQDTTGTAATVTGAAQSAITSLGTLTTLTIDNVIINGSTIGHTGDTDLMTVASGVLTVAGEVSMTTLDIGGTNVTATAAELNYVDGVTSAIQTQMDTKASTGKAIAMAIVFG